VCDCEETDAEVRMMLAVYRKKFVQLATTKLELEKQLRRASEIEHTDRVKLTEETQKVTEARNALIDETEKSVRFEVQLGEMTIAEHHARTGHDEEKSANATLRKRLHQAIKHIDDLTEAICDDTPTPTEPESLHDGYDEHAHRFEFLSATAEGEHGTEAVIGKGIDTSPDLVSSVGEAIADAVLDNAVEVSRTLYKVGGPPTDIEIVPNAAASDSAAEPITLPDPSPVEDRVAEDAGASACTQVWLAPPGPCQTLAGKFPNHGYAERRDIAPPGLEAYAPYCPSCRKDFVSGERPSDPDVAYVVPTEGGRPYILPRGARRDET
ncbi:hypothetical protein LCGC14_2050100, partial [marine sediment metagenome]